jgi:uncharacterized protein (TIGR00369 family)
MRKIHNPFKESRNYYCFGCSPRNEHGLQMEFFEDGAEVISFWEPGAHFQGYGSVLHGGIQATLMDELASWCIFIKLQTAGVTSRINVRFHKPVFTTQGALTLRASVKEANDRLATISVRLFDAKKRLCSESEVDYFIYTRELAVKKLSYPGYESFFEDLSTHR